VTEAKLVSTSRVFVTVDPAGEVLQAQVTESRRGGSHSSTWLCEARRPSFLHSLKGEPTSQSDSMRRPKKSCCVTPWLVSEAQSFSGVVAVRVISTVAGSFKVHLLR